MAPTPSSGAAAATVSPTAESASRYASLSSAVPPAHTAAQAPVVAASVDQVDPFDVFVLESLLSPTSQGAHGGGGDDAADLCESLSPLDVQAALVAFLAEMDAFDQDLRPLHDGCVSSHTGSRSSSIDLLASTQPLTVSSSTSNHKDNTTRTAVHTSGGASELSSALPVVPASTVAQPPPHPPVIQLETNSNEAIASAFSLFAQNRALAFVMELPRKEKPKRRIRAKEEIDTLRGTAENLKREIKRLKSSAATQNRKQQPSDFPNAGPTTSTAFSVTPSNKVDSKAVGVVALETNRQLRKTVKAQLKFTKKFGTTLGKQQNETESSSWVTTEKLEKQIPVANSDYIAFYEALAGKIDAIYTQLDEVFADKSLQHAKVASQDAQVIVNDADRLATLQFRDEKILPFNFKSVCNASWRIVWADSISGDNGGGLTEILPKDDDVLLIKKTITVPLDATREVQIPVRIVFKRFLSKNRMVICWEGTAEWPCGLTEQSADAWSVPMREKGWGLIQPMPGSGPSGGDSGLCHIQICVRMKPGLSDERMMDVPSQVQQLAELVIPTYQQLITSRFQMVENMLLDKYL